MGNIRERLTGTLWGIFCMAILVGLVYFCSSLKREKVTDTPVAETDLVIRNSETTLYGPEGETKLDYWYLMKGKDTLDVCPSMRNPYENAKGIIFIPKKGIYDCRGGKFEQILPLNLPVTPYIDNIKIKASGSKVRILVGAPAPDLKKLRLDYSKVKEYTYNLKTNRLSEK